MKEPIEIVALCGEHLSAVAALEEECFSSPWTKEQLAEEIQSDWAFVLVAQRGGEVLGYAGMHCVLDEAYVTNIAVFPAHRRKGIGRRLLRALVCECRARGASFLSLEVRASNNTAIALYSGEGFQKAGVRRSFYQKPTEDAWIMTLPLCKEKDGG